jgi:hypothetical protein
MDTHNLAQMSILSKLNRIDPMAIKVHKLKTADIIVNNNNISSSRISSNSKLFKELLLSKWTMLLIR